MDSEEVELLSAMPPWQVCSIQRCDLKGPADNVEEEWCCLPRLRGGRLLQGDVAQKECKRMDAATHRLRSTLEGGCDCLAKARFGACVALRE